ncbi:MAG: metal-sensitive transcriptional regulator [Deltaproteobacteria bacterium]|nr:metal-sensitive transcriptional regulator [Deltaproteobacteria bacterium]
MHPNHGKEIGRLNRIEGQVKGIKKMIEEGRYCIDILSQIKAAHSALRQVELNILETHVGSCLKEAAQSNDSLEINNKIGEIMKLLGKKG